MSEHSHSSTPPPEYFDYKHVGGRLLGLTVLAVVSFALVFILGYFNKTQFAFSYLFAYFFFLTICMGGLFWTLVHHAVDAEWSVVVRRQMENLATMLFVMAVLFIPLIFVAPELWTWMKIKKGADILLDEKWPYLTKEFFWIRAMFYFGYFIIAAGLLRAFSVAQDKTGSPRYTVLNRRVTFISAMPFAVALTFAAIDWLMGLDFKWFSTMWGVYIFAGTALSSMCVLVLIVTALRSAGYLKNVVTLEHYHIMGKLMLAFTIFWAYIGFSQYMLIWYANIPEETIYFIRRNTESWQVLNMVLVIGHFFVPFLLLLPGFGKRTPFYLCGLAVWILLMHMLDMYIIVLPALHSTGVHVSWLDVLSLIAIGSTLTVFFLKRLGDASLFPCRDPRLPQSISLKN